MEYIKEVLAAVGGGVFVLVGILTFAKARISKYIDSLIETTSQKSIKKLENKIARNMSAYELLLKKEFDYYESIDLIYAELIVIVQDLSDEMLGKYNNEYAIQCENARKYFIFILQSIPKLKNSALKYQAYIPEDVFYTNSDVIIKIQNQLDMFNLEINKLFEKHQIEVSEESLENAKESILKSIATAEFSISKRLKQLSES